MGAAATHRARRRHQLRECRTFPCYILPFSLDCRSLRHHNNQLGHAPSARCTTIVAPVQAYLLRQRRARRREAVHLVQAQPGRGKSPHSCASSRDGAPMHARTHLAHELLLRTPRVCIPATPTNNVNNVNNVPAAQVSAHACRAADAQACQCTVLFLHGAHKTAPLCVRTCASNTMSATPVQPRMHGARASCDRVTLCLNASPRGARRRKLFP